MAALDWLRKNPKKEKGQRFLGPNWAVFNGHKNNATDRAFALLDQVNPDYAEEVRALEKKGNGIMHIFQVTPTPATAAFAYLVCAFVNE